MIRVLIELWPVTLPTAIYLVWYFIQSIRKHKRGEEHHRLREGPWLKIFILSVIITIVCALALGLSEGEKGTYVPAQFNDGKVQDGHIQ